ncbi:MAG: hypothetical protein V7704_08220 [Aurantimonas endophytica]|uniref:hypothetical protein n=1 Tax=Aurantimonas endophytica TaxID=1522175 RepID=UPI0030010762
MTPAHRAGVIRYRPWPPLHAQRRHFHVRLGTISPFRHYSPRSDKMRKNNMKFTVIAGALVAAAGFLSTPVSAQDQGADALYEMASLDTSQLRTNDDAGFVPVPTPRPAAIEQASAPAVAPVEIRRTAEGIRLVGPRFFPAD